MLGEHLALAEPPNIVLGASGGSQRRPQAFPIRQTSSKERRHAPPQEWSAARRPRQSPPAPPRRQLRRAPAPAAVPQGCRRRVMRPGSAHCRSAAPAPRPAAARLRRFGKPHVGKTKIEENKEHGHFVKERWNPLKDRASEGQDICHLTHRRPDPHPLLQVGCWSTVQPAIFSRASWQTGHLRPAPTNRFLPLPSRPPPRDRPAAARAPATRAAAAAAPRCRWRRTRRAAPSASSLASWPPRVPAAPAVDIRTQMFNTLEDWVESSTAM